MALLFAVITLAMIAIAYHKRTLAIGLIVVNILLTLLMFWYHATDVLKINW